LERDRTRPSQASLPDAPVNTEVKKFLARAEAPDQKPPPVSIPEELASPAQV